MKHSDDNFVTLLQSDARIDILERVQNVEVTDESGTKEIRNERIELAETGEEFRRIILQTPDGEEIEYLTTLASSTYDHIDVISIYTLQTVVEILFRELKQYLNIGNFHSKSLNGVLFELFAALIGLIPIYWLRQRYPVKGGVPRTIQEVRTHCH
jgi:IS4 transposase